MQIRPATENDLDVILALYAQLEAGGERILSPAQATEIFRKIETYPNYHIYIAEQDGEVLGTFALAVMDNLAHVGASSGLIEDVVVDNACRGKGIGKAMMQYALDLCRRNNCYKVCLSSNQKREEAHRFYEALGFQKHGFSFRIYLDD